MEAETSSDHLDTLDIDHVGVAAHGAFFVSLGTKGLDIQEVLVVVFLKGADRDHDLLIWTATYLILC